MDPRLERLKEQFMLQVYRDLARGDLGRDGLQPLEAYLEDFGAIADIVTATHADFSARRSDQTEVFAGRFEIGEKLGDGAQGIVHQAHDRKLEQDVALKRIRLGIAGEALERFRREGPTLASIDHPAVCKVFDLDVFEGEPWMCMPLLKGETLGEWLSRRNGALPDPQEVQTLVRRFASVARGLDACHKQGVVHRDVKPNNLMLTTSADGDETMTVFDFGVAHAEASSKKLLRTADGAQIGTEAYMSPEQIDGHSNAVNGCSDVYSLGIVLFEALTASCPVDVGSRRRLIESITKRELPDPRQLNPAIGRDLGAVIQHATEKAPSRRYATAAEFAAELENVVAGFPVVARPIGPLGRVARWAQREPVLASATVVLAVSLVVSGILGIRHAQDAAAREEIRAVQQRAELDERLGRSWLDLGFERYERARREFAHLATIASDPAQRAEAKRGLLMTEAASGAHASARRVLDDLRSECSPCTITQLEAYLLYVEGETERFLEHLASSPQATTTEETVLRALLDALADSLTPVPDSELRESLDRAVAAVMSRENEPRLGDYSTCATLASRVHDRRLQNILVDALQRNWPNSAAAALVRARTLISGSTAIVDGTAPNDESIGRHRRALEHLERACTLDPDLATAHLERGRVLQFLGRSDEARSALERALELAPDLWMAHTNLGNLHIAAGDTEAALAAYRAAFAISQSDTLRATFGIALASSGAIEESLTVLRGSGQAGRPSHTRIGAAHRHYHLGMVLDQLKRKDEAIEAMRQAIRDFPKFAIAHNYLGALLQEVGQADAALASYRRATELDPSSPRSWLNLGMLLQERRNFKEALIALRRGHELGSAQPGWPHDSAAWVTKCEEQLARSEAAAGK